jgi:RNA polymerase sigma factor (sigma-70 family)
MTEPSYHHGAPNDRLMQGAIIDPATLLRLVTDLAKAEHRRHRQACLNESVTLDDLVSEGWLVAQAALRNFDPEKGELVRYLRSSVSRDLANVVREAKTGPVSVNHQTLKKLNAGRLNDTSANALLAFQNRVSLVPGEPSSPRAGVIHESEVDLEANERSPEDAAEAAERAELAASLLARLAARNPRHALAITLLYGLDGTHRRTYAEVATIMGTSRGNVEQIHARATRALRKLAEPTQIDRLPE